MSRHRYPVAFFDVHHGGMASDRVQVRVILVFGDRAQLDTPWHSARDPMWVPAALIAEQARLPVNELPGREFSAVGDRKSLTDFRLVFDPRL